MRVQESVLRRKVEETLARKVGRFDAAGRLEKIRAAAIQEVAERGFAAASMANAAKRAGVSTATLYRDFKDKSALMIDGVAFVIPILAQEISRPKDENDPVRLVARHLRAHGRMFADPYMGWLFRLYVMSDEIGLHDLKAHGRVGRAMTEAFWSARLSAFEEAGLLEPTHHGRVTNLLLGPVERRTILARLAFGEDDVRAPNLRDVANDAARMLFSLFGTRAFFESRTREPDAAFWSAAGVQRRRSGAGLGVFAPDAPPTPPPEQMRVEPGGARFLAYAEDVLSRPVNRLDAKARRKRIHVAALLEVRARGYDEATMAGVAKRAGVSTATLYREYAEKPALFADALSFVSRHRVDPTDHIAASDAPDAAMAEAVLSQGLTLADPAMIWVHRATMASEISGWGPIIKTARGVRDASEAQWMAMLSQLETKGALGPCDRALKMNMLLGPTQRRSILASMLFGPENDPGPDLPTSALASVEALFRLHGTADFWAARHAREAAAMAHDQTGRALAG
jgi:AcrR family transcriptional regulator